MKTVIFSLIVAFATIWASCSGNAQSSSASLKNEKDSVSYFIGYFMGQNLHASGITNPNMQAFIAGVNTALEKKETGVDPNQMNSAIMSYIQKLMEKAGEENLD